jgi:hypothetical protein
MLTDDGAQGDSTQFVLHSADVFKDTAEECADQNPPVSRRYLEDGDADMGGTSDQPEKQPFQSDLQEQARREEDADQAAWTTVSRQRQPVGNRRRQPAPPRQARSKHSVPTNGKPPAQAPQKKQQRSAAAPVWSTQGAAQLRASL